MCGQAWLIKEGAKLPPVECPKCRSTQWNHKAEQLRASWVKDSAKMTPEEKQSIAAAMDQWHKDDAERAKKRP